LPRYLLLDFSDPVLRAYRRAKFNGSSDLKASSQVAFRLYIRVFSASAAPRPSLSLSLGTGRLRKAWANRPGVGQYAKVSS
jgi:hypothetical protein